MTIGVATVKLTTPSLLISSGSHSSVEIRHPKSHPPTHGAQKPRKTIMI